MFERFSEDARQIVVGAQEEARAAGHDYIGTEHFVVALAAEPERDWTARFLAEVGLNAESSRSLLHGLEAHGKFESRGEGHQIPVTPRAKKVLELSLREASSYRHSSIEPEHLLLALNREDDGVGAAIVRDAGVSQEQIRHAVGERFASHPDIFTQGASSAAEASIRRTATLRPPTRFSISPDPELDHALRLAAARALGDGRDHYGVEDLHAVLGDEPESP